MRILQPVVRGAVFSMAHVPGMVLSGSKPRREIAAHSDGIREQIQANLRSFAVAYPPHQVMIGNRSPETLESLESLESLPLPWRQHPISTSQNRTLSQIVQ